jgi:hypothetical protein
LWASASPVNRGRRPPAVEEERVRVSKAGADNSAAVRAWTRANRQDWAEAKGLDWDDPQVRARAEQEVPAIALKTARNYFYESKPGGRYADNPVPRRADGESDSVYEQRLMQWWRSKDRAGRAIQAARRKAAELGVSVRFYLNDRYVVQGWSLERLAEELGVEPWRTARRLLEHYGFRIRDQGLPAGHRSNP